MNQLKILSTAALLIQIASVAKASWTVQTIMPAGATRSFITFVESDVAYGSGNYPVGENTTYVRAFSSQLPSAGIIKFHPASAGLGDSYLHARSGIDLVGEAGEMAGVWRGGKADAFESLHPTGYFLSTIRAAGNGMLGGSVNRLLGDRLDWGNAGIWNAETGAFVNVHPVGWNQSQISAFAGDIAGGAVDHDGWTYRAAGWTSADPASFQLYHRANDYHSMITAGFAGQFGGWFGPRMELQYASLWDAATGVRTVLHPSGFESSVINGMADGIQVGRVFDNWYTYRAAVWRGTAESVEYLDLPAGYRNGVATSVWTDGITTRVGGYAYNPKGNYEAVVWTQVVPEPASFAGLAAGLALLIRRRRR